MKDPIKTKHKKLFFSGQIKKHFCLQFSYQEQTNNKTGSKKQKKLCHLNKEKKQISILCHYTSDIKTHSFQS